MVDPIEEQRLRTIQREYLDFLDDGVSDDNDFPVEKIIWILIGR